MQHYGVDFNPARNTGMVRCLLHEDRTPSMSYRLDEGLWNCHSCGAGGDSYSMIMKKEDTDFRGARALAASLNLAEGDAGGSGDDLSGARYGRRRAVSPRPGNRSSGGGYIPAWRRR
ncbi:CHC2 zinc finger domain-containing protein [Streptodolium elevatio]|uniref:CHC2 zinc finger domain-containing protein n=1 Tax=Streptodolium elevatio TaxID=3157996 RepID=A0ABV3DBV1_9ACTN